MPCAVGLGFLDAQKDFRTDPWPNSLVRMAHDREPGSHDLAETIPQDHQAAPSSKPVRGSNGCSGPAMAAVLATGSGAPRSSCCPAVGAPNASATANASSSSPYAPGRGNGGLEAAKHFGDGPLARIVEALLREQRTVNPAIAPSLQVPLLVLKAGPAARQPH